MPTPPLIDILPPPMSIRHLIGVRTAELSLLRRLLKLSESQAVIRARAEGTTTQQTPSRQSIPSPSDTNATDR